MKQTNQKKLMITMRLLTGLILSAMAYSSFKQGKLDVSGFAVLIIYLASIGVSFMEKLPVFRMPRVMAWFFLFDTMVVTVFFYLVGSAYQEFYVVYFLTIMVAAGARSVAGAFIAAVTATVIYTWLTMEKKTGVEFLSTSFNIRITLFYVYAIFIGFLAEESNRLRKAAHVLKQHYRSILENVRIGAMVLREDGTIVETNPAARQLLGIKEHAGDVPLKDAVDAGTYDVFQPLLSRLASNPMVTIDAELDRDDGVRMVEITAAIIPMDEIRLIQVMIHDKTASSMLKKIQDDMSKFEIIGSLTANIAHGVNNPLATVMGLADIARRRSADSWTKQASNTIYNEVAKAAQILNGLLKMLGHQHLDKQMMDINRVCEETGELWKDELLSEDIVLILSLKQGLPPVVADKNKLIEVLMIMIHSIRQGGAPGPAAREARKIILGTDLEGEFVIITVRDARHDVGRSRMVSMKKFHSQRIGDASSVPSGLKMCETILVEHDGDIMISPDPAAPCVAALLPVHTPVHPSSPAPPPSKTPSVSGEEKHILVVEDEPAIQELIRDYLESSGYDVDVARNGESGREMLAKKSYDAIVSDIKMPRFSGIDLYYHVQETNPRLAPKIIFVSGDTMSPDTMAFLKSCPNERIEKPFGMERLSEALHRVLTA